jgi:bis(5'-nucleosidyl)-tetraphosphatase
VTNEKSAGAVVFYPGKEIEYLLLLSTYWGFPKGRIEKGEDERTAALREIREEAGLDVVLCDGFRQVDEFWYQRKGQRFHKLAIFFAAQAPSRDATLSSEHEDMIWLPYETALERLKFDAFRELLTKANEFVKQRIPSVPGPRGPAVEGHE